MTTRTASCSCSALAVMCEGEPVRVSVCHCLDCQRRSGSAFAAQVRFTRAQVTIVGETYEWSRIGESGSRFTQSFCPTCGGNLFYVVDTHPDIVAVAIGAFAELDFPTPDYSVYEARRQPWVTITSPEHYD